MDHGYASFGYTGREPVVEINSHVPGAGEIGEGSFYPRPWKTDIGKINVVAEAGGKVHLLRRPTLGGANGV
ncbi:MAG: hypothetical protein ACRD1J_02010 [Terriglobia bacterium]